MKRLLLLHILFYYCSIPASFCQSFPTSNNPSQNIPDSEIISDTTKVKAYLAQADLYQNDIDSLFKYGQMALELSEKIAWQKGIVSSAYKLSGYYISQGKQDMFLRMANKIFDNNPDGKTFSVTAQSVSGLYILNQQYDKAIYYAQKIINHDGISDVLKSMGLTTMSEIYRAQANADSSKYYIEEALKLQRNPISDLDISLKINTLIQYCILLNDSPEKRLQTAREIKLLYDEKVKNNPKLYSLVLSIYGAASLNYVLQIEKISPSEKWNLLKEAETNLLLSNEFLSTFNNQSIQLSNTKSLCELYEYKGDYKNALIWQKEFREVENECFSQENKNKLAAVESERLTEKYEFEAKTREMELASKRKQLYLYLFIIISLVLILAMAIFYSNQKKKINEKLAKSNEELLQANETKSKLFSIINHDLRKPVARLVGYLKFVSALPNAISIEERNQIDSENLQMTENLLSSMESLLDWSRSQLDNFKPEYKKIIASSLFEEIILLFGKNQIQINIPQDILICTDENYIKTIIRNLTTNALKATESLSQPQIVWSVSSDTENIFLTINDNGKGMPKVYQEILTLGVTTLPPNMKGFGLHIIRDLAKTIEVNILVDSNKEGTRITLVIAKNNCSK